MTVAELEDAVIRKLKGITYLKNVETYQGQLDEEKIQQFVLRFPSVLVYMERSQYVDRAFPKKWQGIEFTVLVCDKNLRGNAQARRGDGANPGAYKLLDDIFTSLHNQTLGLAIDPIDIEREEAVVNTASLSVYAAVYRTRQAKN